MFSRINRIQLLSGQMTLTTLIHSFSAVIQRTDVSGCLQGVSRCLPLDAFHLPRYLVVVITLCPINVHLTQALRPQPSRGKPSCAAPPAAIAARLQAAGAPLAPCDMSKPCTRNNGIEKCLILHRSCTVRPGCAPGERLRRQRGPRRDAAAAAAPTTLPTRPPQMPPVSPARTPPAPPPQRAARRPLDSVPRVHRRAAAAHARDRLRPPQRRLVHVHGPARRRGMRHHAVRSGGDVHDGCVYSVDEHGRAGPGVSERGCARAGVGRERVVISTQFLAFL